jgi:hypothetical protein
MPASERLQPFHELVPRRETPSTRPKRAHARRGWRWLWWSLAAFALLLIAARIAAPYAIRWKANQEINGTPGYEGGVGDVGVHLWRGAYSVERIMIVQRGAHELDPFLDVARVDVTVKWKALLHGAIIGSLTVYRPVVSYAEGKAPEHRQTGGIPGNPQGQQHGRGGREQPPSWQERIQKLAPFAIDEIIIIDGRLRFQNVEKGVDLHVGSLQAVLTNLTNSQRVSAEHSEVATLKADGETIGGGHLALTGDIDPFAAQPTFSLKLALERVDLPALNPLTRAYADVDIERGRFDLYAEIRSDQGRLDGYVKPMFTGLDVFRFKTDMKKGAKKAFMNAVVGATGKALQNQPHDRFATEIPVEGRIDQPGTSVMAAIAGVLRNAFVRALMPGFRHGGAAVGPTVSGEGKPEQHAEAAAQVQKADKKASEEP